ncbi:hypothetical protein AMTRI_Chr09g39620 [Amborella trichopoda]
MHIFRKIPSCQCHAALLFYFVLPYLQHRFLRLPCSSIPMAQVNIIEVPEKKDIVVSNPTLAPNNFFYLPLSNWEDINA